MGDEVATHIARFLSALHGESLSPVEIVERAGGEQGYSGSAIRYYDVTSRDVRGALRRETVVSKDAVLLERRILEHLSARGCAVPPLYMPDPIREGRAPVYMPYLEARLPDDSRHPWSPTTLTVADGLAGIHATNLGRRPSWLPLTADGYLDRLWLRAWREQWEANLADPTFRNEFGACTAGLDAAMEQFMAALEALTADVATVVAIGSAAAATVFYLRRPTRQRPARAAWGLELNDGGGMVTWKGVLP